MDRVEGVRHHQRHQEQDHARQQHWLDVIGYFEAAVGSQEEKVHYRRFDAFGPERAERESVHYRKKDEKLKQECVADLRCLPRGLCMGVVVLRVIKEPEYDFVVES